MVLRWRYLVTTYLQSVPLNGYEYSFFFKFSALQHNIPVSEARIRQYHGFLLPGNPVAFIRLFLVSGLLFAQRSEGEI